MSRSHTKAPAQGAGRSAGKGLGRIKKAAQAREEAAWAKADAAYEQGQRQRHIDLAHKMHLAPTTPAKERVETRRVVQGLGSQPGCFECAWCGDSRSVGIDTVPLTVAGDEHIWLCALHLNQCVGSRCSCGAYNLGTGYGLMTGPGAGVLHTRSSCEARPPFMPHRYGSDFDEGIDLTREAV